MASSARSGWRMAEYRFASETFGIGVSGSISSARRRSTIASSYRPTVWRMERIPVVTGGVVGIERERAVIRRLGVCPAPLLKAQGQRETEMRLGQTGVEQEGLFGGRAQGRAGLPRRGVGEVPIGDQVLATHA